MPDMTDVLIILHGMIPSTEPVSPFDTYEKLWNSLLVKEPQLEPAINNRLVGVQWGHPMPRVYDIPTAQKWGYVENSATRPDEKLFRVQEMIHRRTAYEAVERHKEEQDHLMQGFWWDKDLGIPFARGLLMNAREDVLVRGVGDVFYYVSPEGETQVRKVVYEQVLRGLEQHAVPGKPVRIHLVGHSLGVVLTHDFLYGLFRPGATLPDFAKDKGVDEATRDRFKDWRTKAQNGQLVLGSLTSMASQLPLFIMRKQTMIDILYDAGHLDPAAIGLDNTRAEVQWKLFYDMDDILGFATRHLYEPRHHIHDYQVDVGDKPPNSHIGYWEDEAVIQEMAELILANCG